MDPGVGCASTYLLQILGKPFLPHERARAKPSPRHNANGLHLETTWTLDAVQPGQNSAITQ
jgi:hypothetical protein